MARGIQVNGESMVYVKGAAGTSIANRAELGLSESPINITLNARHRGVNLDAWGEGDVDLQCKLADAIISMSLIHFDPDVLEEVVRLGMGGGGAFGQLGRAGSLMGNNLPRFTSGNKFIGLNIASPVGNRPWRFLTAYLAAPIGSWPLGTEKTVVQLTFRAVPYTQDPWNGGSGALNYTLFDRVLDT